MVAAAGLGQLSSGLGGAVSGFCFFDESSRLSSYGRNVFVDDFLGFEVGIAQRYGDDELSAFLTIVVPGYDGAVVKFDERACQVEPNTRTSIAVVGMSGCLIEAFENALELVGRDALTGITNANADILLVVGKRDVYLSASRCELEGIGEEVDDDLVEIVAVNPYGQLIGIMIEGELDILCLSLLQEEGVDITHEGYELGLTHVHLHLTFVNLTQVHHLVDESENTFGITADGLIDAAAMDVVILLDERHQGRNDQRHWRADFVRDIHEELQLGIGHLLSMDVLLQAQANLFLAVTLVAVAQEEDDECEDVAGIGKGRAVPWCMNDHTEATLWCGDAVLFGNDTEVVVAWREVGESHLVDAWLHAYPPLLIDAITIDDMLRIVVG